MSKLSMSDVGEILKIVKEGKDFISVVKEVYDIYKDDIEQLSDFLIEKKIESTTKIYKSYSDKGFTEEQSFQLTLQTLNYFQQFAQNTIKQISNK